MQANHQENKFLYENELIIVKKGQIITSIRRLCEHWKWSNTKVKNFLNLLQEDGMITYKSDTKKTVLTIGNYSSYHDDENEKTPREHNENISKAHQKHTNKNVKNVKNEKNNKKNSRKPVYDETSVYYQLAVYFYEQIKINNPDHKEPNYQVWSDHIRKMIELDKRTEEQVRYLMHWVQQDDFEMVNVLSPAKLRSRFDQLIMKVKQQRPKQQSNTN